MGTGEHTAGADRNDEVWRSEQGVADWVAGAAARERRRAEQRLLMAELLPFEHDDAFVFLDLGAGTGAASRAVLERYPKASAVLADYSAPMREQATRELAHLAGRFSYAELDLAGGRWPDEIPSQVPAVITSLCVHHLPDERKVELFGEIFERLDPGGWYFNLDAVASDDPVVEAVWERTADRLDPEEAERRHHPTEEQRRRHENHVRYMIPLPPQLEMLAAAGFQAIDVYWKQLEYVIYGGQRPQG